MAGDDITSGGFDSGSSILARCRFLLLPDLSIADGGMGWECALLYERSADKRSYAWGLGLGGSDVYTTGKKFPYPTEGGFTENHSFSGHLEFRQVSRYFGDGARTIYPGIANSLQLSGGLLTSDAPPQTIVGEVVDPPPEESPFVGLRRSTSGLLTFEGVERWPVTPELGFGIQYLHRTGDQEKIFSSRLGVILYAGLQTGLGDNNSEPGNADGTASISEMMYGIVDTFFTFGEGMMLREAVLRPSSGATDYLEEVTGQPAAAEQPAVADVAAILSAKTFLESENAGLFHRAPLWGKITLASLDGASAAANVGISAKGKPGDAFSLGGGFRSLFHFVNKLPHLIAEEPIPADHDLMIAMLPATAGCAIAGGVGPGEHFAIDGLGNGCFAALIGRVLRPDPMDTGAILATRFTFPPSLGSLYLAGDGTRGSRGSIAIASHTRWANGHLVLGASLATPYLDAGDLSSLLGTIDDQPEHIYELSSETRAEVSYRIPIVEGEGGSLEARLGLHVSQQFEQTTGNIGAGGQITIGGQVHVTGPVSIGTDLVLYGTANRQDVNLEFPYPTLVLGIRSQ
ncbi:MAG: hypothetical protein HYV02_07535 [Deltaproteobacteria bacterium]|nr:hypothetical protein [Deltaproteobacteria bacterium]